MSGPAVPGSATFARSYRVRFDEAGPDGLLRTSGLLRYAQDVAWQHSEANGFDRPWYESRGLAWLVRGAELEVLRPIPLGADLEVTTAVVGWRKVWARRRGETRLPDGTVAAWVHTDWVLVDRRGAPTRIPPEFAAVFPSRPTTDSITRVALLLPPPDALADVLRVRPHELDPNDHANNAAYLDWLEEAVLAADATGQSDVAALPRRYRLEYVAAVAGDAELERVTWRDAEGWAYLLRGVDREPRFRARLVT